MHAVDQMADADVSLNQIEMQYRMQKKGHTMVRMSGNHSECPMMETFPKEGETIAHARPGWSK